MRKKTLTVRQLHEFLTGLIYRGFSDHLVVVDDHSNDEFNRPILNLDLSMNGVVAICIDGDSKAEGVVPPDPEPAPDVAVYTETLVRNTDDDTLSMGLGATEVKQSKPPFEEDPFSHIGSGGFTVETTIEPPKPPQPEPAEDEDEADYDLEDDDDDYEDEDDEPAEPTTTELYVKMALGVGMSQATIDDIIASAKATGADVDTALAENIQDYTRTHRGTSSVDEDPDALYEEIAGTLGLDPADVKAKIEAAHAASTHPMTTIADLVKSKGFGLDPALDPASIATFGRTWGPVLGVPEEEMEEAIRAIGGGAPSTIPAGLSGLLGGGRAKKEEERALWEPAPEAPKEIKGVKVGGMKLPQPAGAEPVVVVEQVPDLDNVEEFKFDF